MIRPLLSLILGALLALLVSIAAQLMLLPVFGVRALGAANAVGAAVFVVVFAAMVITILRARSTLPVLHDDE